MKIYRVRPVAGGETVSVQADGWLRAGESGARQLMLQTREVEVEVDEKVGFVCPAVVTGGG